MTIAASLRSAHVLAIRAIDAWYDKERDGAAVPILLLLFVAVWTTYHVVTNASVDLHPDLVEVYAWSRHPAPGYYKHPPLNALMAWAWFAIFPATDWSFYLLAMVNAAIALFAIDLIARRYVTGDKRLLVLLLLLLTPFYQFLSERFSTNQTLLSTWPIATYCFLRAFETRAFAWSAAAGAAAALAMLGKYYSVYLLGSFVVAALAHPARWSYLKSPSPWISVAVGCAVLAPHLYWLITTGFQPLGYAFDVHGSRSLAIVFRSVGTYLLGGIAYVALLAGIYLLAARPTRRALADALWPSDPNRRMLVVLLASQLLLPPLSAPFFGALLTSLWTMQSWFLLPIVLLAPDRVQVPRIQAIRVALIVCAMAIGALLVAPAVAWHYHANGTRQGREYFRLVSAEVTQRWRQTTTEPLRIILGEADLAAAVSFYSPAHPDFAPIVWLWAFPWMTADRLARQGWAAVCPVGDELCINEAERRAAIEPHATRGEIEVTPRFLGTPGKPRRFVVFIAAPRAMASRTGVGAEYERARISFSAEEAR